MHTSWLQSGADLGVIPAGSIPIRGILDSMGGMDGGKWRRVWKSVHMVIIWPMQGARNSQIHEFRFAAQIPLVFLEDDGGVAFRSIDWCALEVSQIVSIVSPSSHTQELALD
jgi:hypothetical protein